MHFEETVEGLLSQKVFFTGDTPVFIARAPGRLDLMGGNDDYTGGLVFESTIREATYTAAQLRDDRIVELKNINVSQAGWQGEVQIGLDELYDEENLRQLVNRSPDVRWMAYVAGNLHYLLRKYPDKVRTGIRLYMESSIPFNRGVSSSAAIEVAVMKAGAAAYGIELAGVELALACQWVENVIAGSACGIMDQIAVVTGREGYIMPLVCQPCNPEALIRLPEELKVWGIDSGVSHQVAGIEYEAARASAFMGYKIICDLQSIPVTLDNGAEIPRYTDPVWNGYLANISRSEFYEKYEQCLPVRIQRRQYLEKYGEHTDPFTPLKDNVQYNVRANTRYAVEENQRVQLFSELSGGASASPSRRAWALMGDLMYQSHYAYTECGLGAHATDYLIGLCRRQGIANGIYGAKITGGGAGGTVAILADAHAGDIIRQVFNDYSEAQLGDPYLFEGSSDGADSYGIRQL
ncbi:MAG TPA: galactokinase family protein [Puia sp.]|nr:galactokinase family protein [Puia sp.]